MSASSPETYVRIISNNLMASKFIAGIITSAFPGSIVTEEACPGSARTDASPLLIVDCTQVVMPVSEYLKKILAGYRNPALLVIATRMMQNNISLLLSLGVHGFVLQDEVEKSLVSAAQSVIAGSVWFPQHAFKEQTAHLYRRTALRADTPTLRELQVLELLRRRLTNREIANALLIQQSTVKYHVSNLLAKLQVDSRFDLSSDSVLHSSALN